MYVTCAVLLGFLLDWIFGDPQKLPHPICACRWRKSCCGGFSPKPRAG